MNNNKTKNQINSFDNFIKSAIATTIAEILTIPQCTIKTNYLNIEKLQNVNNKNPIFYSIPNVVKHIWKINGIGGFFKAGFYGIPSQIVSSSSKYIFYKKLDSYNIEYTRSEIINKIINGCFSGILSSVVTHPIEVAKINTQMNNSIFRLIKNNNLMVFYKGFSKSLIKSAIGSSLFLPLFDIYNQHIQNPSLSAFLSAITAGTIMHPFDFLKTRHIGGLDWFVGYNILNYYKGYTLSMMRLVPHFIIMMTTIDYLEKYTFRINFSS